MRSWHNLHPTPHPSDFVCNLLRWEKASGAVRTYRLYLSRLPRAHFTRLANFTCVSKFHSFDLSNEFHCEALLRLASLFVLFHDRAHFMPGILHQPLSLIGYTDRAQRRKSSYHDHSTRAKMTFFTSSEQHFTSPFLFIFSRFAYFMTKAKKPPDFIGRLCRCAYPIYFFQRS